jgi:hypothetical protein
LSGEFLLDLLLQGSGGMGISEVAGDLVQGVKSDTTTLADNISGGEIELVGLAVVLDLGYKLGDVLLDLFIVLLSLNLQALSSRERRRESCCLGLFAKGLQLLLQTSGVYHIILLGC